MTYCGFFLLYMILWLVDLNALVYVDMKIVWFLPIWTNLYFLFSEQNGFILDQSELLMLRKAIQTYLLYLRGLCKGQKAKDEEASEGHC